MNTSRLSLVFKRSIFTARRKCSHGKVLLIKQGSRSVGWLQIAWTNIVLYSARDRCAHPGSGDGDGLIVRWLCSRVVKSPPRPSRGALYLTV